MTVKTDYFRVVGNIKKVFIRKVDTFVVPRNFNSVIKFSCVLLSERV